MPLAFIRFLTQDGSDNEIDNSLPGGPGRPVDPGFGRPGGGGYRPDNSLPWVPPPGHIATLPVFPFDPTRPDNSLPGTPGHPDAGLPPVQIRPGAKFVVKWLACTGLILVPDNELPETPEPK